MVIILSECQDQSTSDVIEWLNYYGIPFKRINRNVFYKDINVKICEAGEEVLLDEGSTMDWSKVTGYWFRRGGLRYKKQKLSDSLITTAIEKSIEKVRDAELRILCEFVYGKLDEAKSIGSYFLRGVNKLDVLKNAASVGLKIPETLITSTKSHLLRFYQKHWRLITKAIHEIPMIKESDSTTLTYMTSLVEDEFLQELPENFFPSLFQECLIKKYELRIFYLNGICKSMAIFSQEDEQTSVDFRYYNRIYPNRNVPFKLPEEVEIKINLLMKKLSLNCGSIDMVVTRELDFVFLEVNPIGQFGMVSYPCNHYLEKDIAEYYLN